MPYMDHLDGAARRMTRNDASTEDELFDGLTSAEVRDAIEALPDSYRVAGPPASPSSVVGVSGRGRRWSSAGSSGEIDPPAAPQRPLPRVLVGSP